MQTRFVYIHEQVCLYFLIIIKSIISPRCIPSSSPATSSSRAAAWLELTCTAENVFLCARVGFKTCTRAIHVVRVCERACERAGQCASERASSEQRASVQRAASERAASSERQRACIAPLLYTHPSLGTKLGCVYIQLHAESA